MHEDQEPDAGFPREPSPPFAPGASGPGVPGGESPREPGAWMAPDLPSAEPPSHVARGLTIWFVLLSLFGVGGLLLGQEELAALAAVAGLFVAAQAADLDRAWRPLHQVLSWIVPAGGAAIFTALGFLLRTQGPAGLGGLLLTATCFASAAATLLTYARPVSNAIARALFAMPPSHTLRLAARLVAVMLLFAVPGWFAMRHVIETLERPIGSMVQGESLGSGLVGYILLAFASVGFLLRRSLPETLARLGLSRIAIHQVGVIAAGVVGLFALNAAADWTQRLWFHDLWLQDQRMNEAIGGHLGVAGTIVLGLSAGIGEELTLRGALQPRLGLFRTSLLFAALHVQYSWYGMMVILLLGLILGLVRQRANTTVAIAVHALYDMAAVFSIGKPT